MKTLLDILKDFVIDSILMIAIVSVFSGLLWLMLEYANKGGLIWTLSI